MTSREQSKRTVIATGSDLDAGVAFLRRRCLVMKRIHALTGDPPLRRWPKGFHGLARIIVGQQLSIASAGAIWSRVEAAVDPLEPRSLLGLDDPALIACGLSRPKIKSLRALATAVHAGNLKPDRLARAPDETVRDALMQVSGIGPWTADIYLMFCLGRADAWASGDLALQIAVQRALGLEIRPDRAHMEDIARRWRPWRAVAARLLWAYYALPQSNPAGERDRKTT